MFLENQTSFNDGNPYRRIDRENSRAYTRRVSLQLTLKNTWEFQKDFQTILK